MGKKSKMSKRDELGLKAAEEISEAVYGKYGDKLPVNIDPTEFADKIYPIIRKQQKKHDKKLCKKIAKTIGCCMIGMVCVSAVTACVVAHAVKSKK